MVFGSIFVLAGAHKLSVFKHCGVEKYPPYYLRSSHYINTILKYYTDKAVALGCISLKTAKICSTMVQDHQSVGEKVLLNNNNAI